MSQSTGDRVFHQLGIFLRNSAMLVSAIIAGAIGSPAPALAQGLNIIRDAEIETMLAEWARPGLLAGGIVPESVTIRLINDDSINAFVTRGNAMYFHTGLILAAKNSNEVIGVMAHETGHIVAGHAVTFGDNVAVASTTALLATLLGVAAGVASGNPDVGAAIMLGGQGSAQRMLFAFSRGQESSADQYAIRALEETQQSPQGLYSFFNRLSGQEMLISDRQDPYVRTHPLTRERMGAVDFAVKNSAYKDKPADTQAEAQFRRMTAKLFAFLKPQLTTFQKYPEANNSPEARYAQSIAFYRRGQMKDALPVVDSLLKDFSNSIWPFSSQK